MSSAKPMPTKPPVATVSPARIRRTASRADATLPDERERMAGADVPAVDCVLMFHLV
ncbi:hypothetical protein QF000_002044 [Paraburkholderia atlantica]